MAEDKKTARANLELVNLELKIYQDQFQKEKVYHRWSKLGQHFYHEAEKGRKIFRKLKFWVLSYSFTHFENEKRHSNRRILFSISTFPTQMLSITF